MGGIASAAILQSRLRDAFRFLDSEHKDTEFIVCLFVLCFQCWENGIILCRELADQYESYYDYRNLSKMRVSVVLPED